MVMFHVLWFIIISYASIAHGTNEEYSENIEFEKSYSVTIIKDDDLECETSTETSSCNGDPNAIYKSCGNNNCGRFCSDDKNGILCPAVCRPGCNCKPNYVYDEHIQKCVLPSQCTSCNGDPNAIYKSCGNNNCGRFCSEDKNSILCPAVCRPGCNCKPNYVYDENIQKCVLPSQCTPVCKKDEVYNSCTNTGCVPQNCTELGFPIPCKRIDPRFCVKGCVCAGDKLRAKNGTCVPRKQCDSPCGGDKNAVSGCGNNCEGLCSNRNNNVTVACTLKCNLNGCDCKKGYLYDDATGKCVSPKNCSVTCEKNEIYSSCVFPNCNFEKCSDRGKEYNCPLQNTSDCVGKCICQPGYLRNTDGVCTPVNSCPSSCNGDPNAIYNSCGNNNCGRFCSEDKNSILCPAVCRPGCNCKPNYVYDENIQKCVLPSQCTPVCKKDEVYSSCINNGCVPQNCTELGFPIPCKKIDPKFCVEGCICADDKLRHKNGTCVPRDKCETPCGGDKNSVPGCGSNCGQLCSTRNNNVTVACKLLCNVNGCDCKKGYLYDEATGKCVLPNNCSITCGKNERYSSCVYPNCYFESCSDKGKVYDCPVQNTCIGKCICQPGYLRHNGICIPEDTCPSQVCKSDEVYNSCVNNGCVPENCTQLGLPLSCAKVAPGFCIGGCLCQEDSLRDKNGNCVPKTQCDSPCGDDVNAISGCGGNCGRYCTDLYSNYTVACKKICDLNGCDCKDGFWYDDVIGKCVLPEQCPSPCGENEIFSKCVNSQCSPEYCSDLGKSLNCGIPTECYSGCLCKPGFLRDRNGICIEEKACPITCNGDANAIPGCGINCGRYCSDYNSTKPLYCNDICSIDGCDCKEGYYYDYILKKCVLPENCTPTSCNNDTNAVPGCGINCGRQCYNYNSKEPVSCLTVCFDDGCDCKEGYVFDGIKNKCVLPENCTPEITCNINNNEVYSDCVNDGCSIRNCTEVGTCKTCNPTALSTCTGGCVCKDGYLRASNGRCVPSNTCNEITCDINNNEVYSDCVDDGCSIRNCNELGTCKACNPTALSTCTGGCVCKDGYLRASNGRCVPSNTCNGPCKGDDNAVPGCGLICGNSCGTYKIRELILCIQVCYDDGCDCKPGYVLDENTQKCVLPEQCSTPICKTNEVYSDCINNYCGPRSCDDLGNPINCQLFDEDSKCVGGCICQPGYLYNKEGVCVPREECDSCGNDSNATPGCGGYCGQLCSNFNSSDPIVCPLICNNIDGCDCRTGFVLNELTGKCVVPEECPTPCGKNEVLSKCIETECKSEYCNEKDTVIPCIDAISDKCTSGCICRVGYYRNRTGFCVPEKECPTSCNDDPNALPGCGVNCGKQCSGNLICPRICYPDGCDCKTGFLFDDILKKCVKPNQCTNPPIICGINEEYSNCANSVCRVQNCTQKGQPVACTILAEGSCQKGCICKPNYLRGRNGTCVPENECDENTLPPQPVCGVNEEYNPCVIGLCRAQDCTQKGNSIPCPDVLPGSCKGGCVCKENYLKSTNGTCVPENECDVCPDGENYLTCPPEPCDAEYCPKSRNDALGCISNRKCSKPRCVCGFNRHRDRSSGKCIATADCPPFPCKGEHEIYEPCGPICPGQNCTDYINNSTCPKFGRIGIVVQCQPKCRCKKGYYRNNAGVCILGKNCLKDCKENEEYSECTNGGCAARNCTQLDKPVPCVKSDKLDPKDCIKGCVCKKGYLRNSNGLCVPTDKCDKPLVCGENEISTSCINSGCYKRRCNQGILCVDPIPGLCIRGCRCKPDYVRDDTGKCIPESLCPGNTCTKPNEIYDRCLNLNNPRTCDSIGKTTTSNPLVANTACSAGCRCIEGHYRNASGYCVPQNECPLFCGENEIYTGCINSGCYKRRCNQGILCVDPIPDVCIRGCRCKPDYVRDDSGKCIPESQCPVTQCGDDEVLSDCVNGGCDKRNCTQYNSPAICVDQINFACINGCVCKPGLLRNKEGKCIPQDQCPESQCNRQNEIYDYCAPLNDNQTCESIGKPKLEPVKANHVSTCVGKCRCKNGFYRNKIGECISIKDCLRCTGPHEYYSCGGACDNECATYPFQSQKKCPIINVKCNEMCYCEEGYARNDQHICIPIKDCQAVCRKDEILSKCPPAACDADLCPLSKDDPIACISTKECKKPRCVCPYNHRRDRNTTECIHITDCPPFDCTGENEKYVACPLPCPDDSCGKKNTPCPLYKNLHCKPACRCKNKYCRNKDGVCKKIKKKN